MHHLRRLKGGEKRKMKNTVSVDLKKEEDFYSLRLDMLTSGACKAILPMNVIKEKNFMRGIYDTSGYCRLADLHQIDAASVLTIVERVLELLDQCREYLIFSDEIVLAPETLYVSEDFHTVRLTYIPEKQNHSEKTKLGYLLSRLERQTTENGKMYLETVSRLLSCGNLRTERVISFLEELKQEIRLCEIQ